MVSMSGSFVFHLHPSHLCSSIFPMTGKEQTMVSSFLRNEPSFVPPPSASTTAALLLRTCVSAAPSMHCLCTASATSSCLLKFPSFICGQPKDRWPHPQQLKHRTRSLQFAARCASPSVPGVLLVRSDKDQCSISKDYSFTSSLSSSQSTSSGYSSKISTPIPRQNSNYWLVRMKKPKVEVVTKAQVVDYYVHILTKVLGNEKDAQMSMYNISWEEVFGFCCHIDHECAQELSAIPAVISVYPDANINSEKKDYKGLGISPTLTESAAPETNQVAKTKRLFVTGLSFYTSEKTVRAAFESFGQLVEVKIIMDKISKRSKGYAFIEYTTEEAAGAALKEMNGKIINGWMIVVDVAKINPPRNSRGRSQVERNE